MFDEFPELDYPRFAKDNSPTQHINEIPPKKNKLDFCWRYKECTLPTQHINQPKKNKTDFFRRFAYPQRKTRYTLRIHKPQHINQPKGFIIDFDIDLTADAPRRIDWRA